MSELRAGRPERGEADDAATGRADLAATSHGARTEVRDVGRQGDAGLPVPRSHPLDGPEGREGDTHPATGEDLGGESRDGKWSTSSLPLPEHEGHGNVVRDSEEPPSDGGDAERTAAPTDDVYQRLVPGGGLDSHESRGGHTLDRHVGLSESDLRDRLLAEPKLAVASTFSDRDIAERALAEALDSREADVHRWLESGRYQLRLEHDADRPVGLVLQRDEGDAVEADRLVALLRRDPDQSLAYYIHTSYPATGA